MADSTCWSLSQQQESNDWSASFARPPQNTNLTTDTPGLKFSPPCKETRKTSIHGALSTVSCKYNRGRVTTLSRERHSTAHAPTTSRKEPFISSIKRSSLGGGWCGGGYQLKSNTETDKTTVTKHEKKISFTTPSRSHNKQNCSSLCTGPHGQPAP